MRLGTSKHAGALAALGCCLLLAACSGSGSRAADPSGSHPDRATTASTPSPTTATRGRPSPGGFPDASNTGVPPGTALSPYTGPCTVRRDGSVIDAKTINCDLAIKAAHVTISRSQINGLVSTDENSTGFSFRIGDSTVNVGDRGGTGIGAVDFIAVRVHVTGGNRSINCWHDCVIRDSYVHGQVRDATGTFHESGIRMGQRTTIRHNTIVCDAPTVPPDAGCSAGLTGYGDFGPVRNNTIDHNLFRATTGGTCAYGGSSAGKPFSEGAANIRFTDNVFERGPRASDHGTFVCGGYAAVMDFDPSAPGNVWRGNTFDDGSPVPPA